MDRGRAAAALLALAACIACSTAAPTSSDQTALDISEGASSGCYYNFQHYGEGDRIMTNEPCLNCTCHNRMLMCYLRVCPFTKAIGQDCTIEKRADQCCPIVTCPDVPVDLLTSTSTSSPAEYGATGLGKLDKYGCSINGKYFPEGSKVPPSPNKPCEHCYCIRNMTTCVMQECTLHVDGCTPIYHKDVCCPVRYSCDHPEDEIPLLDDMTTTIRPTPGFLLTTTTMMPVTQSSQNCVHDDQIVPDGALIKTEKACEHCYCMKGDIVCVVQECGTPMENEGKNCTSLPPRQGQCCPDTYICEGDEVTTAETTEIQELTTIPPRRYSVEGSGYRLEPDETYTEIPSFVTDEEGSGEEQLSTLPVTEKSYEQPTQTKETSPTHNILYETSTESEKITTIPTLEETEKHRDHMTTELISTINEGEQVTLSPKEYTTNRKDDDHLTTNAFTTLSEDILTTESPTLQDVVTTKVEKTTRAEDMLDEATLKEDDLVPEKEHKVPLEHDYVSTTPVIVHDTQTSTQSEASTTLSSVEKLPTEEIVTPEIETQTMIEDIDSDTYTTTPKEKFDVLDTTTINPIENEIHESDLPIYSPGRIPGEGDCLFDSITYQNNSIVPSTNNCHASCRCISSIIKCEPIVCSAPPEYMNDCQPIYDSPESCCPTYVCSTKETIPPESHNQMTESESAKPVLANECNSPDCESLEDKFAPSNCSNNECIPKDKVPPISCDGENCKVDMIPETYPDLHHDKVPPISCDGENCKVDMIPETYPDLHHDAPVECSPENGCTKPVHTQSGNDCSDGNCKNVPASECTGSDCDLEIKKPVIPVESITDHEHVTNEFTEKPDTTYQIETQHDSDKEIETSTQRLNADTKPTEEYITVPIKPSFETSQTESSKSQDMTTDHAITEAPEHLTTLVDKVHTEPSVTSETEYDLTKQQQSTSEPVTTESENTYQDVHQATSDQTTTRTKEQTETESQTVTVSSYETEPTESATENIAVTSQGPKKETIIPTIDQVTETNVDITKIQTDSTQHTTESILKETVPTKESIQSEVTQENTITPDISAHTISDSSMADKVESSTLFYSLATESDQKLITKPDEHYTESPLGYEDRDKITESVPIMTESDTKTTDSDITGPGERKPVYDDTGSKMTDEPEIHDELPITEATKLTEPKIDTTAIPEVTNKYDQDHTTERIEEQTAIYIDERKEVTTGSITTDANIIHEKQTTEAQLDYVTSAVLREKESTITETIPTEKVVGGDEATTEYTEGLQETYTKIPEFNTTEKKTSTDSGYHYQTTSPAFDEKSETSVLPVNEVPIIITTESEQIVTSETITPKTTEKEVQVSKEVGITAPQGDIVTEGGQHDYYTTEESYEASSQPPIDKDLSEKPRITTVSSVQEEEIVTTQNQKEFSSTVKDVFETSKDNEIQVPVEASTVSYHEVTTEIVTLTDTAVPIDSSETVTPAINIQPETDTKQQITEANIEHKDTPTTESEIKVDVSFEDIHGTSTETNTNDVESYTEKTESEIPTKEVTSTDETSTRIPSEEITKESSKETEHEKVTKISEPVTALPEKTESTTRIIEIDSETKIPETYMTSIPDVVFDVSTVVPGTSEYGTKEAEMEVPSISTTQKVIDHHLEITTVKEFTDKTDIEEHAETGSGEEDIMTSSPTPTGVQEEIMASSSATETPIEETKTTKGHIDSISETFEPTTQSYANLPKETSSPSGTELTTAAIDAHDESTETIPITGENSSQTEKPEEKPDLDTEKTIEESTEPLPERDDQQSETPLEASTPISIHEEISTPHSALSLVTDETEKEHIEPHTHVTQSIPVHEKDELTTEPLLVDQGLSSTERLATKEPETLTTFQQEPVEHEEHTTLSDEKLHYTDLAKYPEVITEYPEKTTAVQVSNEDNEIPHSPISEVSQTILPETTYESQPVTKAFTPSSDLYETTTHTLLEVEKEEGDKVTTTSPIHYDKYDTTPTVLLDTEPEKQATTKETLPDIREYGTTLPIEIDSEKEGIVTEQPSILITKQPTESPEQTNKMQETTHVDISEEATTSVSPNVISDKDMEIQSPTVQSIPSKEHHDITTAVPTEKMTEKETDIETSTGFEPVPTVPVEEQTEKEILREPNKDVPESTTIVTFDTKETPETKVTTDTSLHESTTLKSLQEDTNLPTITQQTMQEGNLYQPTTITILPEKDADKEIDSDIQSIVTTSDTSFTSLDASSSTPISRLPESTDDAQKSTEPAIPYSETTPYLIELQEHTHLSIDELSSKMPMDGESTTEQYISVHPDRGDIPHKDDDANATPTSHDESADVTTMREDTSSTTPKSIPDVIPTEESKTTAQLPSEIPIDENKYTVLPIETEKPFTTPVAEAHTEKHIPDDYDSYSTQHTTSHKPDISNDTIAPTEEVDKVTSPPAFTKPSEEPAAHNEELDKPEEKPTESTVVSKPETEPSDDIPSPDFPPSGGYGQEPEPDYGDGEDQAFGPGTCRYGGKVYVSAQQIPRDDPCDFCFCFRSDIICLQQSCPPPIHGCHEEPIQGFCCPRYECPVSMATTLNVTTTTTTTTTTLPPHFLPHAYKGAAQRRGCQIKGHTYKVGEVVRASSGPCLHCTCGGDGQMKCDPKACTPEPMLRQMIAAAVSAKRRR